MAEDSRKMGRKFLLFYNWNLVFCLPTLAFCFLLLHQWQVCSKISFPKGLRKCDVPEAIYKTNITTTTKQTTKKNSEMRPHGHCSII